MSGIVGVCHLGCVNWKFCCKFIDYVFTFQMASVVGWKHHSFPIVVSLVYNANRVFLLGFGLSTKVVIT